MRIKQTKNNQVNSFRFSYNIFKNDCLKHLLELFGMKEVLVSIYGLESIDRINYITRKAGIQNSIYINKKDSYLFVSNVDKLQVIFDMLGNFDEIVVWNCFDKWENMIQVINTNKGGSQNDKIGFYLNYNCYENNFVDIISDIDFNNTKEITSKDILKVIEKV